MTFEFYSEHVKAFLLVPVCIHPQGLNAGYGWVVRVQCALDAKEAVAFEGEEMIDDRKLRGRVSVVFAPASFINGGEVVKLRVRFSDSGLEICEHFPQTVQREPQSENLIFGLLFGEDVTKLDPQLLRWTYFIFH